MIKIGSHFCFIESNHQSLYYSNGYILYLYMLISYLYNKTNVANYTYEGDTKTVKPLELLYIEHCCFKLLLDAVVFEAMHECCSITFELLIHHLLSENTYSHYNLKSIFHSLLLFLDSKPHSKLLMHPVVQIWVTLMQWKIRNLHESFKCHHIQLFLKWN